MQKSNSHEGPASTTISQSFASRLMHVPDYLKLFPEQGETLYLKDFKTLENHPPARMYKVRDVFILGKNAVLCAKSGEIFKESSFYELDTVLKSVDIESEKSRLYDRFAGEYLPLCSLWSEGFWHWVLECLPKVIIAESLGFKGYYIVPPARKFIYESLNMLGIESSRILDFNGIPIQVETLVIPETIQGTSELCYHPDIMQEIRSRILSNVKGNLGGAARRMYVARKHTIRGGKIVNEADLLELFSQYGIERVYMEELSLQQQIELDMNAELLIAPHGAGMVHSLFIKPSSLVIEMFSPQRVMACMYPVLNFLRHEYHMVVGTNVHGSYKDGEEIVANITILKLILDRIYK